MLRHEDIKEPWKSELIEMDGVPMIVPVLTTQIGEKACNLTWWNCQVRTFEVAAMNHVEIRTDGKRRGIRFSEELFEGFVYHKYPQLYLPVPEEADVSWFMQLQTRDLEEELDSLADEDDDDIK